MATGSGCGFTPSSAVCLDVDAPMEAHAVWAALIDHLQDLEPSHFAPVLDALPYERLDDVAANYLAALVDMAAAQKGVPPPPWTARVRPLANPWFGTDLQRLREYLLLHAPVAFRRRNLFVDAGVGDRV